MIEKLVTSKTRIKILKFFLSHIDDRYYLRELERMLEASLSPLRRQLVKLTGMGILIVEEEANLKYYSLNKNFEGLEELKNIVLGSEVLDSPPTADRSNNIGAELAIARSATPKQFRYDLTALVFISLFVLATAVFVVYANNKNIKMVSGLVVEDRSAELANARSATPTGSNEMVSKKWKVTPGDSPIFSKEL